MPNPSSSTRSPEDPPEAPQEVVNVLSSAIRDLYGSDQGVITKVTTNGARITAGDTDELAHVVVNEEYLREDLSTLASVLMEMKGGKLVISVQLGGGASQIMEITFLPETTESPERGRLATTLGAGEEPLPVCSAEHLHAVKDAVGYMLRKRNKDISHSIPMINDTIVNIESLPDYDLAEDMDYFVPAMPSGQDIQSMANVLLEEELIIIGVPIPEIEGEFRYFRVFTSTNIATKAPGGQGRAET